MIIYKKADVILTLGSRNTLIPLHGTPSKVIFRTLRILMSMMIDLFIHQWREIFIWTMPSDDSDQTTPRARPIFKFVLWLDTIKAVTSQFVPVIKCWEKKKDDEQGDIIKVVRGAALICFWPSSNPSEPRAAILYSFRRRRLQPVFYFFKFSLRGSLSVVHLQTSARWTITPDCSFDV